MIIAVSGGKATSGPLVIRFGLGVGDGLAVGLAVSVAGALGVDVGDAVGTPGNIRNESLLAAQNGLPCLTYDSPSGPQEYLAPITGSAMAQDASVMAVSFCTKGDCEFSSLGGNDPNAEGEAFRSVDGGLTWQEIGRGGTAFRVVGALADGRIVASTDEHGGGTYDYVLLPDNTPVESPVDGVYPVTVSNEIFWATNDGRLLLSDGTPIFAPPDADPYLYRRSVLGSFSEHQDGQVLVYWELPIPTPRPVDYVDRFAVAVLDISRGSSLVSRQWELDGYLAAVGWWSANDDRAAVSIVPEDATHSYSNQTPLPAILDLRTGTFNLIPSPFKSDMPGYSSLGRTTVRAVQIGPFARVTGTGSCLKVRAEPSLSGGVLTCAADGVLLRDTGATRTTDGAEWVSVMTPGGMQGWASSPTASCGGSVQ